MGSFSGQLEHILFWLPFQWVSTLKGKNSLPQNVHLCRQIEWIITAWKVSQMCIGHIKKKKKHKKNCFHVQMYKLEYLMKVLQFTHFESFVRYQV